MKTTGASVKLREKILAVQEENQELRGLLKEILDETVWYVPDREDRKLLSNRIKKVLEKPPIKMD